MARLRTVTKAEREAALKVANRVRKMLGKRPVKRLKKGERGAGTSCPIARTIDWDDCVFVCENDNGVEASYPGLGLIRIKNAKARDFIKKFDSGLAPDLELP